VTDPIDPEVFYPPASMFLTRIPGRSGWWVGTAQALLGMPSRWTHGGVIGQGGGTFEAAPGGVQLAVKAAALGGAETRGEYERHLREAVLYSARELLGTPYSFLDYLALALYHLAPKARITALIRKRVEDSKHLICSAFVDRVMDRAGIHLYDDGRLSGDVTPSDLNAWFDDHNHIIDRDQA
jgi:hypothetical protein